MNLPYQFRWLSLVVLASLPGSAAAETSTFVYHCEGVEQAIVVTADGTSGYLFSRWLSEPLQREAGTPAYHGEDSYYLPAQSSDIAPGQTAAITIQGNQLDGCENNPSAAIWEDAKLRGVSFRAIGQEPPWVLEIDRQFGFLLMTGYDRVEHRFPYSEPVSEPKQASANYRAESNGDGISITVTSESCRDSMSGAKFSSRVEITWREQILHGCGRPLH